jgi:hypothetical protein
VLELFDTVEPDGGHRRWSLGRDLRCDLGCLRALQGRLRLYGPIEHGSLIQLGESVEVSGLVGVGRSTLRGERLTLRFGE